MSPRPVAKARKDEDKSRAELIEELEVLRSLNSRAVMTKIDITESQQVEEARKSSEAKFRAMFDNAGVAIFIADVATGEIIDCNQEAENLLGLSRGEIIGLHQTRLHPADNVEVNRRNFVLHSRDTRVTNYETKVQHKDGRIIPVIINAMPLTIDDRKLMMGFFIDITERKQAEEALRVNEQFLNNVFDSIQDGICILDKDLNIIRVNHVMEEYYPHMMPLVGKKCYYTYHGRQSPCEVCPSLRAIKLRTAQNDIVSFEGEDGRLKGWQELFAFPLKDNEGNVTGVIEHVRDITERKQADEALKEAKAQSELYLDLMGHDINNMHQIALGYLEIARDMHQDAGEGEFLDKSIEVLQRSAILIKNVRKLQKLTDRVLQLERVDVCKVLLDVQMEFGSVPHKAITLNLNGCEHCLVRANDLLRDVFVNLVGNAVKHTGERAEILVDLDVAWNDSRQYCRVTVEDNGPGIPDDFKGVIFKRALKGTARVKGIGLGLYIVKSLVESYGGWVWVEDRVPGDHTQGARFVVMLPAAEH